MRVPNEFRAADIAIIGEAPGEREVAEGRPFVGYSGSLLWSNLSRFGILRDKCFVGNVSQIRPPNNDFHALDWDSAEVQEDIHTLESQLTQIKPNLILCLGNAALHLVKNGNIAPPRRGKLYDFPNKVGDWRGSLFRGTASCKAMSTFHPAFILRAYDHKPYFLFDLHRAAQESRLPDLILPVHTFFLSPTFDQVIQHLAEIKRRRLTIAMDIEGGVDSMTCISIACDPLTAFIIPFVRADGTDFWTEDEECEIWRALADVLSDPEVPKILQNYLYDAFVLAHSYRTLVRGIVDDTMLKWWEINPELEKSLGVQASILTRVPYYKDQRETTGEAHWRYCCTDSAVTFEGALVMEEHLRKDPKAFAHYQVNVGLLAPLLYMQLVGIRFDREKREALIKKIQQDVYTLQARIDDHLGYPFTLKGKSLEDVLRLAHATCCYARSTVIVPADLRDKPKKDHAHHIEHVIDLVAKWPDVTEAERGELETILECGLNVDSFKQMAEVLYGKLALPIQYKKEKGRKTDKVTTDALALLTIFDKTGSNYVMALLYLRNLKDRIQNLSWDTDPDGRMRASYILVGSETGRIACKGSNTGSGGNLQTVTKKDRHLYLPDTDDDWLFQLDLSGADGWTVAAHCYALGDHTMLDDYRFGLKPAKIGALLYEHGPKINTMPREQLKELCKTVDPDSWVYFAFKRVQHGTNYGMKPPTVSDQILKDSYKLSGKPIRVATDVCERLQHFYLSRYPGVLRWHGVCEGKLRTTGKLQSAGGHTRTFHGRRDDDVTLREFLADEPQENTTWAINLALYRLWTDKENRTNGRLIVQPKHQVHDALIGQFPKSQTEFSVAKLREYFNNTLLIAGIPIVIPFEGGYGPSWGELPNKI